MTIILLEAPAVIASQEAQSNEFIIDTAVKSCLGSLTIYLFGEYIPSLVSNIK